MPSVTLEQQIYQYTSQSPLEKAAYELPNGQPLALKHETERCTGSFKELGMLAAGLTYNYKRSGLVSAGGAAIADAFVARELGNHVRIYVPEEAAPGKKQLIRKVGGTAVTLIERAGTFAEVQEFATWELNKLKLPRQSAYDDPAVIFGHNLVAKETIAQTKGQDGNRVFFVTVGGASLLAGTLDATAETGDRVVAVQFSHNTSLEHSLRAGEPTAPEQFDNLAEGSAAVIGNNNLEVIQKHRDRLDIVTVSRSEVGAAITRENIRRYHSYDAPYPNGEVEAPYRFPETTGFVAETGAWQYAQTHEADDSELWTAVRSGSNRDESREQALLDTHYATLPTTQAPLHMWNGAQLRS